MRDTPVSTTNKKVVVRGVLPGAKTVSDIVVEGGKVIRVSRAGSGGCDAGSAASIIAPTLFDIQVNGYGGIDLQGIEALPEDVARVDEKLQRIGVSHWIPTIITSSFENTEHGCAMVAAARKDPALAKRIPGVHIEGPYISPDDGPRGAHDKRHVRKPDLREFDRWYEAAEGQVAYITLAPELDGAISFIKEMSKRGVIVSLGHHNATPDQIARAVDAGARMCTHLGNGLAAHIPRHSNPLWPQLAEDRLYASVIADLEHLPPHILKTIVRVKGPERTVITSDAVHIAGLRPGHYNLVGMPVELKKSGRICLSGTELLAGSATSLLQGVINTAKFTDLTLEQAFACASSVPAKLFGVSHRFGVPKPGASANLICIAPPAGNKRAAPTLRACFVDGIRVV
ncbi:MAG: amidohydrolase family protein [Candidatus Hydrogenedentes bacterium]|nr:amidohydrolase family protein [Candidatus Hydrogenedentota bacterium]